MRSTRRVGALFPLLICLQISLLSAQAFAQDRETDAPVASGQMASGEMASNEAASGELASGELASSERDIPASGSQDAQVTTGLGPKEDPFPAPTWEAEWGDPGLVGLGITGVMAGSAAAVNFGVDPNSEPNWRGPILADRFVHESLRASTPQGRDLAAGTSDVLVGALIAAPLVIEPLLLRYRGDDWSVAGRMAAINAQGMATALMATTALKFTVGRARPPLDECWDNPDGTCEDREAVSFPSGHTSMAFAGAGLVCLNHEMLSPLGGAWDDVACYTALSAATATGVLRMVAHKHYMSDVFVGAAIGVVSGYFLPKWLYFGFGGSEGLLAKHDVMVAPSVGEVNGIKVNFSW